MLWSVQLLRGDGPRQRADRRLRVLVERRASSHRQRPRQPRQRPHPHRPGQVRVQELLQQVKNFLICSNHCEFPRN